MTKKSMLFISTHLPSTKVPQAGHREAYETLKRYSADYAVHLITFVNTFEQKYFNRDELSFCATAHFVMLPKMKKVLGVLTHLLLPLRVASRANGKVVRVIKKLEKEVGFDAVHFYFTAAMYYRPFTKKTKLMESTVQDITFQSFYRLYQQSKFPVKWFYWLDYIRFKKWEVRNFCRIDKGYVLNDKDKMLIVEAGVPENKIEIIRPFVDEKYLKINRQNAEKNSMMFWGAMNRYENVDGIVWFLDNIFPKILQKIPDCKVYVVGANPTPEVLKRKAENVIVTGFVDSPIPYFEKATLAIAPLRLGAGIKIKVLEALAAGLTVIATPVGAEGIHHERLKVANEEIEFARLVSTNLQFNAANS